MTKHFSIDFDAMTFSQKMDCFMQSVFPQITKEESDFIAEISLWSDETRMAFVTAKRLFENKDIE